MDLGRVPVQEGAVPPSDVRPRRFVYGMKLCWVVSAKRNTVVDWAE